MVGLRHAPPGTCGRLLEPTPNGRVAGANATDGPPPSSSGPGSTPDRAPACPAAPRRSRPAAARRRAAGAGRGAPACRAWPGRREPQGKSNRLCQYSARRRICSACCSVSRTSISISRPPFPVSSWVWPDGAGRSGAMMGPGAGWDPPPTASAAGWGGRAVPRIRLARISQAVAHRAGHRSHVARFGRTPLGGSSTGCDSGQVLTVMKVGVAAQWRRCRPAIAAVTGRDQPVRTPVKVTLGGIRRR